MTQQVERVRKTPEPSSTTAPALATGESRRLHEIYFPKPLLGAIRRERARADRQKGQFSLVMFRLVPARGRWANLRLCNLVLQEVRTADEVGQFDPHTVCAILPDTAPDGAQKLIDRVRLRSQERGMTVEPVVYTYPSSWLGDKDDDEQQPPATRQRRTVFTDQEGTTSGKDPRAAKRVQALPLEALLLRRPSWMKRAIDLVAASSVLLIASPAMVVIAGLIKYTSPGPVVFKQWRCGMGGQPFQIYKFRTMCDNADAMKAQLRAQSEQDGPAFKMTRDPRVTSIGKLLRKTSLDELPQLFNVLKGDMSLVGPRPLPLDEQAQCDQWHRSRLDVKPGLTCIWQVHGRSQVTFEQWMRMDLSYIRRYEVLHDIKLMLQTIPAVLLRRGAK
ncbi:MAG TPA: sugar transferase [Tepidisphaeraceae bacterium]|jgi:lipopolysaccharide/colanic/teichoic acid biosynthesis glycosyltransferase